MSRRALEHQNASQRKREEEAASMGLLPPRPPSESPPNAYPVQGNKKTMNMNNILYTNIQDSIYFKERCAALTTFHEVVDEIYNQVDHLEPFLPGLANSPSTAFCLLYKLFTMRLSENQLVRLITHPDSPYIRALGFLYIRFCCYSSDDLWDWFKDYIDDPEPVKVRIGKSEPMVMGKYLRGLLKDQSYFTTRFPRIPVLKEKEILQQLNAMPYDERRWNGEGGADDDVQDRKGDDRGRAASRRSRSPPARSRSRSPVRRGSQYDVPASPPPRRGGGGRRSPSPRRRRSRSRSPSRRRSRSRSPVSRRRSPSPRRRSPSPRKRSPSPRKRSPSPRRRSPSPRKRSPSPRKRSPSPRKRSLSPRKRSSRSPDRRSNRDKRRSRSRSRSPRDKDSSSRSKKSSRSRSRSRSPRSSKHKKSKRSHRSRSRSPRREDRDRDRRDEKRDDKKDDRDKRDEKKDEKKDDRAADD